MTDDYHFLASLRQGIGTLINDVDPKADVPASPYL